MSAVDDDRRQGQLGERPSTARFLVEDRPACGALGCLEEPTYEVVRFDSNERRVLCEKHAEEWCP